MNLARMGEAPPTSISGRKRPWQGDDDDGHAHLVETYLRHAGFTRTETHRLSEWVEDVSDPMTAVVGRAPAV